MERNLNVMTDAHNTLGDDNAEGVESRSQDDLEFDAEFGDGAEFMDIHLPDDSAVSQDEKACIDKFRSSCIR